jgi:ATP-dependent DNA helicase RecG
MHHVLRSLPETLEESLPTEVGTRQNLRARKEALHNAHFPAEDAPIEDYNEARSPAHRRLIFEEFFWLSIALGVRRGERIAEPKGAIIDIDDRARSAMSSILPFTLTRAQGRALGEILSDMSSQEPMNRLLQGDVGSGKTIVAVQAVIAAIENGYQAAFMVPTEILAEQHARNIKHLLSTGLQSRTANRQPLSQRET